MNFSKSSKVYFKVYPLFQNGIFIKLYRVKKFTPRQAQCDTRYFQ
jgi:hypothetical protein